LIGADTLVTDEPSRALRRGEPAYPVREPFVSASEAKQLG